LNQIEPDTDESATLVVQRWDDPIQSSEEVALFGYHAIE
jgi:hypothetical protein